MPLYEVAVFVNDVEKGSAPAQAVGTYFTLWVSKTATLDTRLDDYEAGESPAAVLIQDSFTDLAGTLLANHMPEIGGAWIIPATHPRILNNQVGMSIIGSGYGRNAVPSSVQTCYAQATYRQILGTGTTFRLYICCEVDSPLGGDYIFVSATQISLNGTLIDYLRQDGDVFKIVKRLVPVVEVVDHLPLMGVH